MKAEDEIKESNLKKWSTLGPREHWNPESDQGWCIVVVDLKIANCWKMNEWKCTTELLKSKW